ncbi:26S proteasome non-ATPase regulatory subunit 1 [Culex quinquefasciatus]|uniref:26S proteasome non-ATPase regulatory subunit 1 n=1 Tax=Culex quinquefasciatus TaxID=7176 RepID=UPI0018E2963B|nr:26S proteasome non-ATPase regulatory subunit 1 [Culex quinquefasciatus]
MDVVESSIMKSLPFRDTVLRCLYLGVPQHVSVNMCQCRISLEDPLAVAKLLDNLSNCGKHTDLMAYYIWLGLANGKSPAGYLCAVL